MAKSPPQPFKGQSTRLIRAGVGEGQNAAVRTVGPVVQRASTVILPNAAALYDESQPTYGMNSMAVHDALRAGLCEVEHAAHVELFSSGLAACTGAITAVVEAGDEVLVADCVYGPTRRFCDRVLKQFGVAARYFPATATAHEIEALIGQRTRLIVLESPGSITFEMQDIPAIAEMARRRGVLTMVDNTWAAGVLFRPLDHGVDLCVHALTKYVCGHSDMFLGSVATATPAVKIKLQALVRDTGASVSPDDAFQAVRGLKTLQTRLDRHGASGVKVARWLAGRPEVSRVLHPALGGDPGHALWRRDFTGACGLFGLVMAPAPQAAVHAFLDALELFGLGFSWGGYESLAIHCDPQIKRTASPWRAEGPLVRLHVGLEDTDDLIADLEQGLRAFAAAGGGAKGA
jgi:cystathionine beta-lyase